jgi:hypothetical protein
VTAKTSIWRQLDALEQTLASIVAADPEQEVRGIAVPVLDAVVAEARNAICDNSALAAISDVISAETIAAGEPIRAVDALLVVSVLKPLLPNASVHSAAGIRLPSEAERLSRGR